MSARELVNLTKKRCRQVLRQRGRHRPTKPNSRTCLEESELECGGGSCCWKVGLRNGERCALASFLRSIWSSRPCSFRTTRTSWRSIAASSTLVQGGMRLLSVRATRSAALSGVSLFMASVKWRRAPLSDTRYSKITVGGAYLSAKRYRCERRCLGNSSFRRQSSHVAKYARHSQIMSRNRRSDRHAPWARYLKTGFFAPPHARVACRCLATTTTTTHWHLVWARATPPWTCAQHAHLRRLLRRRPAKSGGGRKW
jgi:hypothetical protein